MARGTPVLAILAVAAAGMLAASLAAPTSWAIADAAASAPAAGAEGAASEGPVSSGPAPVGRPSTDLPSCAMPAVSASVECGFACVAGQEVHAFMEGQGTIKASCGGDECTRAATIMGGCGYLARTSGQGTCSMTGVGDGRCYTIPVA